MPVSELKPEFVHFMPEQATFEEGVIYISMEFETAHHLCACGCGHQTVTPFGSWNDWTLTIEGEFITLSPSIGNFQFPCRSHYFIRKNKIEWV